MLKRSVVIYQNDDMKNRLGLKQMLFTVRGFIGKRQSLLLHDCPDKVCSRASDFVGSDDPYYWSLSDFEYLESFGVVDVYSYQEQPKARTWYKMESTCGEYLFTYGNDYTISRYQMEALLSKKDAHYGEYQD